ncbi:DUF192 domain-containing protein [Patescibacteria group bacterium]|nr:DUF192 domain-containing protein [Patescibacteria group bacterium]
MKQKNIIIAIIVLVVLVVFIWLASRLSDHGTLAIPGGELDVLVADNFYEHQKGLSGTEFDTLGADGMIFLFNDQQQRTFWMKGMNYDLDIVWIADGKIVKIKRDVPAPEAGEEPAQMHSRPFEVDMVLELPAGGVAQARLLIGHFVEFNR